MGVFEVLRPQKSRKRICRPKIHKKTGHDGFRGFVQRMFGILSARSRPSKGKCRTPPERPVWSRMTSLAGWQGPSIRKSKSRQIMFTYLNIHIIFKMFATQCDWSVVFSCGLIVLT